MQSSARQIIFIGRVQGVGFRFTAHRIANRHFLTGFVRNLYDGSVEVLAQGRPEDIDDCIAEIKEALPGYITDTKTTNLPTDPRHKEFKITF
jgi:acylphosphatase